MKRLLLLLCALAVSARGSDEAPAEVFIIQSHFVTSVYGDSIVREVAAANPDKKTRALFVRNFETDRFLSSRAQTVDDIVERAKGHANLVLLGHDVSFFRSRTEHMLYFPVLASYREAPDLTSSAVARFATQIEPSIYGSTMIVINDGTTVSKNRFRVLASIMPKLNPSIKIESFEVTTSVGLQKTLTSLNSRRRSLLVNNCFTLDDQNALKAVYSHEIDRMFVRWNKAHIEVGLLKREMAMGIGVGLSSEKLAAKVLETMNNKSEPDSDPEVDYEVQINITRMAELGLSDFALRHAKLVNIVEVR